MLIANQYLVRKYPSSSYLTLVVKTMDQRYYEYSEGHYYRITSEEFLLWSNQI